jgi:lipoprotein-releasing system permease protein
VRIATFGIVIGVAMMILSLAIVNGFQQEIRNKVIGFGSHFQITSNDRNFSKDSQRLLFKSSVYDAIRNTEGVSHVQVYATKPGIIETSEALQGVVIKGVGKDFDWTFLREAMKEGTVLESDSSSTQMEILVSSFLATRMKLKVGDRTSLYFFNEEADPRQRNFTVKGIYETGLEDFDKQFVFVDISHVQRLAGWGIRLEAQVDSQCVDGYLAVGATAFGGGGEFRYQWSDSTWRGEGPHFIQCNADTTIRVIARDQAKTLPDTSWITVNFLDDTSSEPCRAREISITSSESDTMYIGGYEVLINDYRRLLEADDRIFSALTSEFLQTQKITDRNPEIFSWLEMLDINVAIIIVLMVVISVVNMTSALLIIILERQNMIGTLKALGIQDKPVVGIFIRNAAAIIGKGVLWGNIIGIGLAFLQWKTGIVALDPENYYVDKVPVKIDLLQILLLDIATLLVCVACMILPAMYVTRISPIRAIRFS